jgi:hypothetical protein
MWFAYTVPKSPARIFEYPCPTSSLFVSTSKSSDTAEWGAIECFTLGSIEGRHTQSGNVQGRM